MTIGPYSDLSREELSLLLTIPTSVLCTAILRTKRTSCDDLRAIMLLKDIPEIIAYSKSRLMFVLLYSF